MKRTVLSLMLLLGGTSAALAHEGPQTGTVEMRQAERGARLAARFGLDANQTTAVRETMAHFRAQLAPVREDARTTRVALADELKLARPNDGKVAQLTSKLLDDRQAMMKLRGEKQVELQRILRPTQFARLVLLEHGRGMEFWRRQGGRELGGGAPSVTPEAE
jgi:Spy/CpxP family protein refolding chaperone